VMGGVSALNDMLWRFHRSTVEDAAATIRN
jgi:hypothetical protein